MDTIEYRTERAGGAVFGCFTMSGPQLGSTVEVLANLEISKMPPTLWFPILHRNKSYTLVQVKGGRYFFLLVGELNSN